MNSINFWLVAVISLVLGSDLAIASNYMDTEDEEEIAVASEILITWRSINERKAVCENGGGFFIVCLCELSKEIDLIQTLFHDALEKYPKWDEISKFNFVDPYGNEEIMDVSNIRRFSKIDFDPVCA